MPIFLRDDMPEDIPLEYDGYFDKHLRDVLSEDFEVAFGFGFDKTKSDRTLEHLRTKAKQVCHEELELRGERPRDYFT